MTNTFYSSHFPSTCPSLDPAISKALERLEFSKPTPIQLQAIPVALTGQDIVGCAQTGTGKTAAFCIPILSYLKSNPQATALVLVPTRELAAQIADFWKGLSQYLPQFKSVILIGGVGIQPQVRAMKQKPSVLIATPGRLNDHLRSRTVQLKNVGILVLDEADRMLDMGFAPQLAQILPYLPPVRQTFLFSATLPQEVERLLHRYTRNPVRLAIGKVSQAAAKIDQKAIFTTNQKKNDLLLDHINATKSSILVFARTKSRTDRVARYLESYDVDVSRIHGGRSQGQRNLALAKFRSGQSRVLVATDIASRGIDVDDIGLVVNYDLPHVPEDYIHRIGRTARNGNGGAAVAFVADDQRQEWRDILALLKKTGSETPVTVSPSGQPTPPPTNEEPPSESFGKREGRPQQRFGRDSRNSRPARDSGPRSSRPPRESRESNAFGGAREQSQFGDRQKPSRKRRPNRSSRPGVSSGSQSRPTSLNGSGGHSNANGQARTTASSFTPGLGNSASKTVIKPRNH